MEKCKWQIENESYNSYWTGCDEIYQFSTGDIKSNDFVYCPFCGKEIEIMVDTLHVVE